MTDELLARLRQSPVVGRYFETDGSLVVVAGGDGSTEGGEGEGAGGEENGGEGGEGSGGAGGEAASGGEGAGGEGTGAKPMSQAEIDAIVEKRLGQAKKAWEKDAKTAADREKMDEVDRLKAEKEDSDKAAAAVTERANQRLVQADAKVAAVSEGANPKRVDALLKLVDLSNVTVDDDGTVDSTAVAAAIKAGLEEFPEFKAGDGKGAGRSGGNFNGGDGKTWTRDEISKLSDDEFDKHKDEIQAAVAAGKVA